MKDTLRIESVAVGDELLDGRIADKNTKDLGDALAVLGLELRGARTVPDDHDAIVGAVKEAAARADIVVTSGGLGPTSDDITAACVADAAGVPMRFDDAAWARIQAMFEARKLSIPESNKRQATLPSTSRTLENEMGTAPGFVTPVGACEVWSFPGVPREYRHLLEDRLLPHIRERAKGGAALVRRTLRSLGVAESAVGERLTALSNENPDVRVQYRTLFPEILVRLVLDDGDAGRADALAARARNDIGPSVYGDGDDPLEVRLLKALDARKQTVAAAESCTGGLVAKRVTDVPGSSSAMLGGVVSYANSAKVDLLEVPQAALDAHGAVSEEVARAMAEGARKRFGADFAVSTTGVAGPGGGTAEKPVGLVWFAVAGPRGTSARRSRFPDFGRERIREMAAATALRLLLEAVEGPQ